MKLRNFLKLIGLGSLLPTLSLPESKEPIEIISSETEYVHVTWSITSSLLLPYTDSDGTISYDTNRRGVFCQIIGDAVKCKPGKEYSPTMGLNSYIGRLQFESEPLEWKKLSSEVLTKELDKIHTWIKNNPDAFTDITQLPKCHKIV